ncbi:MAG: hypothetical protein IT292_08070 [Deltaproteobacteria bacterium]|nr:hypothetical protein [Deltaproteobacteria bacterium]
MKNVKFLLVTVILLIFMACNQRGEDKTEREVKASSGSRVLADYVEQSLNKANALKDKSDQRTQRINDELDK